MYMRNQTISNLKELVNPLASLKEEIAAWANREIAKSTLSHNEIARRGGFSAATLHRILGRDPKYTADPKWQNVVKLARVLGVKPPDMPRPNDDEDAETADAVEVTAAPNSGLAPTQSLWQVNGTSLVSMGYMPGDSFILDQSVKPANRECVVAHIVDYDSGTTETILRVFLDGFLVTPNYIFDGSERHFVDGRMVQIVGTIVKSWRERQSA